MPSVTTTAAVWVLVFAVPANSVTTAAAESSTSPVSSGPIVAASVMITIVSLAPPPVSKAVPATFAPPVVNKLKVKSAPATLPSSTGSLKVTSTVFTVTVCALTIAGPAPSVAAVGP